VHKHITIETVFKKKEVLRIQKDEMKSCLYKIKSKQMLRNLIQLGSSCTQLSRPWRQPVT